MLNMFKKSVLTVLISGMLFATYELHAVKYYKNYWDDKLEDMINIKGYRAIDSLIKKYENTTHEDDAYRACFKFLAIRTDKNNVDEPFEEWLEITKSASRRKQREEQVDINYKERSLTLKIIRDTVKNKLIKYYCTALLCGLNDIPKSGELAVTYWSLPRFCSDKDIEDTKHNIYYVTNYTNEDLFIHACTILRPKLKKLHLSCNTGKHPIDLPAILTYMKELTELHMIDLKLEKFHYDPILFGKIIKLDLSSNRLTKFSTTKDESNLKALNLANNQLQEFDSSLFKKLKKLIIYNNNIKTLDLSQMPNLEKLEIDADVQLIGQEPKQLKIMRHIKDRSYSGIFDFLYSCFYCGI